MKHLKSSLQDLRQLFAKGITVSYIAASLKSLSHNTDVEIAQRFMQDNDFDVVGLTRAGKVIGYVERTTLKEGVCEDCLITFDPSELVSETTPLIVIFKMLCERSRIFVLSRNWISGIATRGDLQKAPVRMWLFGLISLLEMQLVRIIRLYYPDESWKAFLSDSRIMYAQTILEDRIKRNEATDLADCLQLCDKKTIVNKSELIRNKIGIKDRKIVEKLLQDVEPLRNNLAHGQDIITGFWPQVVELAEHIEILLEQCERTGSDATTLSNNRFDRSRRSEFLIVPRVPFGGPVNRSV